AAMAGHDGIATLAAAQHGTPGGSSRLPTAEERSRDSMEVDPRDGVNSGPAIALAAPPIPTIGSRARGRDAIMALAVPVSGTRGSPSPVSAGRVVEAFVQETGFRNSAYGADKFGFRDLAAVHWNLTAPNLYEHAIRAGEAAIVQGGALCAETGVHTGRSPRDKHTVVDAL